MIVTCDPRTYPGSDGPFCGATFDDATNYSTCPHEPITDAPMQDIRREFEIERLKATGHTLEPAKPVVQGVGHDGLTAMLQEEIDKLSGSTPLPDPIREAASLPAPQPEKKERKRVRRPVLEVQGEDGREPATDPESGVPEVRSGEGRAPAVQGVAEVLTKTVGLKRSIVMLGMTDSLKGQLAEMTYPTVGGERTLADDCGNLIEQIQKRIEHYARVTGK